MRTIPLAGKKAAGRVALVDDEDYDLVMAYVWYCNEGRGYNHGPYAIASVRLPDGRRSMIFMHKLLTGWPRTDHANHDGLDNQRRNLRPATSSQNQANRHRTRSSGTSQFKGVYWDRRDSWWIARIMINRRHHVLGYFRAEEDAARAYDAAALEAWGEYAYLNFPVSAVLPRDPVI